MELNFRRKVGLITTLTGIVTAILFLHYIKSDPTFSPVNSYQVYKMKFQFSSDWTHSKTEKIPYIFQDKNNLYSISVYKEKIQNESADDLWSTYSTSFDNYKLQTQSTLKVGEKNAKKWKFSYTSDSKSYEEMITIITYWKTAYFIQWQSQYGFGQYDSPEYEALLKSVTWK